MKLQRLEVFFIIWYVALSNDPLSSFLKELGLTRYFFMSVISVKKP